MKKILVFICLFLMNNLLLAGDGEKNFRKDLLYYQKSAKQKNLNLNNRIYLLEKVLSKYRGQEIKDFSSWERELERMKIAKSQGGKTDINAQFLENQNSDSQSEKDNKKDYVISAGDLLGISVFPAEEFSREVVVQPDGNISLPLIGKVLAAGLTIEQLSQRLTRELSLYVANPRVSVLVKHFGQRQVFILGEIMRPGVYEYRENLRLWELITQAGGLTGHAILKSVKIYRGELPERKIIEINLAEKEKSKDFLLEVGDIIDIARGEKKIYVLGEVRSPGSYEHKENLKLVELISLAGGVTENGIIKKIRVFRGDTKQRQTFTVNLSEIVDQGHLEKDIDVQAGDIVYVPKRAVAKSAAWITNFLPWISMVNFALLILIYF